MLTHQEILNDLLLELGAARVRLIRLRKNPTPYDRQNGNNSFDTVERCEREIEELEAELEKLQKETPELENIKVLQHLARQRNDLKAVYTLDAEIASIRERVHGNTVQVVEAQPESETQPAPHLQVVDTGELDYWYNSLSDGVHTKKFSNKQHVFFQKNGKLVRTTLYSLISRGIPGKVQGLNAIDRMTDYTEKLSALRRLGTMAKYFGFVPKFDDAGNPITTVEQITPEMVDREVEIVHRTQFLRGDLS